MKFSNLINEPEQNTFPSLESIDYQINDPFGPNLEAIVGQFVDLVNKKTPSKFIEGNKELKDKFNKLVLDRLGINAYLITDNILAATMPNIYNPYNIVNDDGAGDVFSGEYNSILGTGLLYTKKSGFTLGGVDTKKAKLSGWFTEHPIPVFVNFIELVNDHKLTAPEITAVILHELGHDFEGAALCARTAATNQTIADATRRAVDMDHHQRKEFIYNELKKVEIDVSKEDVEGMSSANPVVMGVSAFRAIIGAVHSFTGSRHDTTTYESLSDSFATRFGYGEYLATGLDKLLNTKARAITKLVLAALRFIVLFSLINNILKSISVLRGAETFSRVAFMSLIRIIERLFSVIVLVNVERENTRDMTYDLDKDRFIRVRNDLVNSLKTADIDKKTLKSVLEQIKLLDDIIGRSSNFRGFIGELSILISPFDRKTYKAIKAQQDLEKMIANDIFVSSNKLQTK